MTSLSGASTSHQLAVANPWSMVPPLSLAPQSDFAAFDAAAYPRTIFPRR